ncbi:MAG TPA: hypothetical protein VIA18_20145, partial [Polyangia bacterium]|nr:hypothetical protein [Polyangia bacterium]
MSLIGGRARLSFQALLIEPRTSAGNLADESSRLVVPIALALIDGVEQRLDGVLARLGVDD